MNNAISLINEMPTTKVQIKSYVEKAKAEILSGEYNPIPVMIQLTSMEKVVDSLRTDKEVSECLRKQIDLNGGKYENDFASIVPSENGTKYDFSRCNDVEYIRLSNELERLKKELKERETFLKYLPVEGLEHLDKATGEVYLITRPSKTSTSGVKITLK